jgi:hypothetical protein|tara:strand:- start:981 stop:1328 length:348 start_codon:yes stop_codon:yes gene_type:complete
MKYIIIHDQGAIADLDAADELVMFPRSLMLSIDTDSNTAVYAQVQNTRDVDNVVTLAFTHADANSADGSRAQRQIIDDMVRIINMDNHNRGYNVLHDGINNEVITNVTSVGVTEA